MNGIQHRGRQLKINASIHRSCFYNSLVQMFSPEVVLQFNPEHWSEMTWHVTHRCHECNIFAQPCLRAPAATSLITATATQRIDFLGQGSRSAAFELIRHYFSCLRFNRCQCFWLGNVAGRLSERARGERESVRYPETHAPLAAAFIYRAPRARRSCVTWSGPH